MFESSRERCGAICKESLKDENLTESQIGMVGERGEVFAQAEQRRRVAKRNNVVYTQRERIQKMRRSYKGNWKKNKNNNGELDVIRE